MVHLGRLSMHMRYTSSYFLTQWLGILGVIFLCGVDSIATIVCRVAAWWSIQCSK